MSRQLKAYLFSLALALAVVMALQHSGNTDAPEFDLAEYQLPTLAPQPPLFQRDFISPDGITTIVHSGTLVELPGGDLLAAWFGGSREGAADVAIYGSRSSASGWSPHFILTDRSASQRELSRALRKLGNPVLMRGAEGRIWLFYVTVSLGGWSTSSISYKVSEDNGHNWSAARRLVTSPFLNISTQIRARPLLYADGSIALPAHHELAGKFSELLQIDPSGRVRAKHRMSAGRVAIQPSAVPTGPRRIQAFFRRVGDSPPRVLTSESEDGGSNWSPPNPTDLPNPDASIAALRTPNGEYLLAYNHSERNRASLSLAISSDGVRWRKLIDLESDGEKGSFSYPYIIRSRDGEYHLIYTWQLQRMAYVRFNDAWLESLR